MRPHRHFGGGVYKSEVTRLALQDLRIVAIVDIDVEKCVVVPGVIILRPRRELLVGRHQRRGDIMGEQVRLCVHVQQLDEIAVTHIAAAASLRQRLGRNNLPVIVGIVVPVSRNLLAW